MHLISYNSKNGNVGDDLNDWLWPKIFGEQFLTNQPDTAFLGIGSILIRDSDFVKQANTFSRKIIFGTGVRSINEFIELDESWDLYFLRGPFGSLKLKNDPSNFISDGAYFIMLLDEYQQYLKTPKKYPISFIPYFQSIDIIDWKKICDVLGWHLILPTEDVESFISQVAASEQVISEAMHGAIFADILRVPWKRFRFYAHIYEGEQVSEFKWNDWLFSIEHFKNEYVEAKMKKDKGLYKFYKRRGRIKNEKRILQALKNHENIPFSLSSDKIVSELVQKMKIVKTKLEVYLNS